MDVKAGKEVLSPTSITDYFRTRKSNRQTKGRKGISKSKNGVVSMTHLYPTPESSPASIIDPESPIKESSGYDTQDDECKVQDSESTGDSITSSFRNRELFQEATAKDDENLTAKSILFEEPESLKQVSSESLKFPKKCSCQEKPDSASISNNTSKTQSSIEKYTSPDIYSIKSVEAKATSLSPCLPRLKLRKNAKAKSQSVPVSDSAKNDVPVKSKPNPRRKNGNEPPQKSVITDFFPVRRSGRQTKTEIEKEKKHQLEQQILSGCEDGLEIRDFENKGRGVVATKAFQRGDFVVEYAGDLIDLATAKERENKYGKSPEIGCYMYYFKCGAGHYCVDATSESGRLGRLLNHSAKGGNCCTRSLEVQGQPHLILVAKRDISSGEELTYDYGDRSKAALESHPWLKL